MKKNIVIKKTQHIAQLFQSTLLSKKQKRVLLVEVNGFGARALVVRLSQKKMLIECSATSSSATPVSAISDIVKQLSSKNVTTPKEAILLSAHGVPALLDLPIEENAQFSNPQMQEMVRWEMENMMSAQVAQWNIGWLLMGRGYLDEQQRDDILQVLENDKAISSSRGGRAPARFGEEAIKQGYITREQLEECLAIQEELYLVDDAVDCSWLPSATTVGKQKGLWFCCAMSSSLRQRWVAAFRQHAIRLQWVYPLSSSVLASLHGEASTTVLLELQAGYIACARIEKQQITQYALRHICDHAVTAQEIIELCQSLLTADIQSIYFSGSHPRQEALVDKLSGELGRPFIAIESLQQKQCLYNDIPLSQWSSLIGAGQHFLNIAPQTLSIQLQGEPPPPPLYKQGKVQFAASVIVLLLAVLVNEVYFSWRFSELQNEQIKNEEEITKIKNTNESIAKKNKADNTSVRCRRAKR